jgi:4-amino-4-deoxychorismate lyase
MPTEQLTAQTTKQATEQAADQTTKVVAVLGRGVVDPETPVLHADDLGFTRGDGCFEGLRLQTDAAGHSEVDKLDAHLARMSRSAQALGIDFDAAAWRALIEQASAAWAHPGEAAMRLLLSRGRSAAGPPNGLLTIEPLAASNLAQRRDGISVITLNRGTTADAFADAPWLLGGVKTISYAVNMAAQREAARRGADDAILISADGWVLESSTGSVVWSRGRTLLTTPLGASGILGGTTQQLLFERAPGAGWATDVTPLQAEALADVEALWILSSVRGPVDVNCLDGRPRTRDLEATRELQRLTGF